MKKYFLIFTVLINFPTLSGAYELGVLNEIIKTEGFSFNSDGDVETDWQKDPNNRNSGKRTNVFSSDEGLIRLSYSLEGKTPSGILIVSKAPTEEKLYASFDQSGQFLGAYKCAERECAAVSKQYCQRLKSTNVAELKKLPVDQIVPTADELREISKIKSNYILDLKPKGYLVLPGSKWLKEKSPGFEKFVVEWDYLSDKYVDRNRNLFSEKKISLISKMCEVVLSPTTQVGSDAVRKRVRRTSP